MVDTKRSLATYYAGMLFALAILLSACFEREDSLAPVISITEPRSGTVRSTENLTISGYALDNHGIRAIFVDGSDLLDFPLFEGERGKRLVQFGFIPQQIDEGQWASYIVVEDMRGRSTELRYVLEIDTTAPELELNPLSRLGDGRVRVSGVARDNHLLARLSIAGVELSFPAVSEKVFSLDVRPDGPIVVRVEDQAGNVTSRTLTP